VIFFETHPLWAELFVILLKNYSNDTHVVLTLQQLRIDITTVLYMKVLQYLYMKVLEYLYRSTGILPCSF